MRIPWTPSVFLSSWQGEITDHETGPGEGEVTLLVSVTHPERRAGRCVRVTLHRDLLHDLLAACE